MINNKVLNILLMILINYKRTINKKNNSNLKTDIRNIKYLWNLIIKT